MSYQEIDKKKYIVKPTWDVLDNFSIALYLMQQ